MAPRLKVFVTSDGLTDYVVATSSKAKALAAWGVRQDLFAEGRAHQTDDPNLVGEALARPGEVLRRASDGSGALAKLKPAKAAPQPKRPSKAALKKAAGLEAKLAALEAGHAKAARKLDRARAELDRKAQAEAADYAARREQLDAALSAARRAPG